MHGDWALFFIAAYAVLFQFCLARYHSISITIFVRGVLFCTFRSFFAHHLIRYPSYSYSTQAVVPKMYPGGKLSFYYDKYCVIYYDILQVLFYDVMTESIRSNMFNLAFVHQSLQSSLNSSLRRTHYLSKPCR